MFIKIQIHIFVLFIICPIILLSKCHFFEPIVNWRTFENLRNLYFIFKATVRSTEAFIISPILSIWWCLSGGVCPGTFQALWLVDVVHEGYLTSALIGPNPPPTEARKAPGFVCTQCTCVLLYKPSVQPYNCFKQSVCTPRLDKKTIAGSVWPRSKMLEKKVPLLLYFKVSLFSKVCIRAKMSDLGHFRRFPMALIWYRRTWARCYSSLASGGGSYNYVQ
jgi:hypothetical protein